MDRIILQRRLNNRAVALVALALVIGGASSGRGDRELTGLSRFSQTHKGASLWYDASGHLLVAESGQTTDPLAHVTAFAKPPQTSYPSLSPDGKRVAFVQEETSSKSKSGESQAIWIAELDGSLPKKLVVLPWVNAISWSPTADRLAFISEGLKTLTLSDRHITIVAPDRSYDKVPSWSPDGHQIVYESATQTDHPVPHVCVADLLSGEIKTITEGESPSWSPKGNQIAYLDSREQAYFSVSPTGTNKHLLVKSGYAVSKETPVLRTWLVCGREPVNRGRAVG